MNRILKKKDITFPEAQIAASIMMRCRNKQLNVIHQVIKKDDPITNWEEDNSFFYEDKENHQLIFALQTKKFVMETCKLNDFLGIKKIKLKVNEKEEFVISSKNRELMFRIYEDLKHISSIQRDGE